MPEAVIGHYRILGGLGRGATGSVYRACDQRTNREVAIKVLDREVAKNNKHRQRFEREARAIAALKHPNIVEVYDYGDSAEEQPYLVMELIRGPQVGRLCREHGPMPELVLAALGVELATALAHAHEHGIIHRDLKPENVFLDGGRVVLADFGVAKAIDPSNPLGPEAASPRTDVIGTPGFMAPEQLLQEPLDHRTDLFAFGALLYYLATTKLPYDAESPYALVKQFRGPKALSLGALRPDLSQAFVQMVDACVEPNRFARPASAEHVRKHLRAVLDGHWGAQPRDVLSRYQSNPSAYAAVETRAAPSAPLFDQGQARDTVREFLSPRLRRRLLSAAVAAIVLLAIGIAALLAL